MMENTMTTQEVLRELEGYGNAETKKIFFKNGAKEPFYGVKVQDLKKIQKRIKKQHELNIPVYSNLLDRVEKNIHKAENRVRYTMNGFVIAIGCYIKKLTEKACQVAKKIGKVNVDMGGTACKVPQATAYIKKVIDKGRLGKKRKKARC